MKSAFELAMERFGGPLKQYSDDQKAQLAEIDSTYESQIVQARFASQARIEKAEGNFEEIRKIQEELADEIRSLEARRERKKEELRKSFDKA
ncbi:MAG: hypothetical protein IJS15_03255 [Victivallales bacterium]|nr:hypothetical protein [Victivallales bacterium]